MLLSNLVVTGPCTSAVVISISQQQGGSTPWPIRLITYKTSQSQQELEDQILLVSKLGYDVKFSYLRIIRFLVNPVVKTGIRQLQDFMSHHGIVRVYGKIAIGFVDVP